MRRTFARAGKPIALTPKAFDTLLLLLENGGRVVTKDVLISEVWPETFIEENNLAVHISVLRKSLAGASDKEYIRTVPKLGYSFVADVHRETSLVTVPRLRSVAILPFKAANSDRAEHQRVVGLTDAIITRLSQLGSVAVCATSSVLKYSQEDVDAIEVARALNVDAVVSGRFAQLGDRARLTVQLINVETGTVVWAEKLDHDSSDAFAYEDVISEHIAQSLDLKLTGEQVARITKRYTENSEAHQAYLQGRYHFTRRTARNLHQALQCFEAATSIDPNYAPAYSGLADCYSLLSYYSAFPMHIGRSKATEAAQRALQADETLAEAHASTALVAFWYDWDWHRAKVEFERALTLNPSYASARQWYCWLSCAIGEFEQAEKQGQLALEVDPMSAAINMALVKYYFFTNRLEDTIRQCERVLALDDTFLPACYFLGQAYLKQGMFDEAVAAYERGLNPLGGLPLGIGVIGHAKALAGDRQAAEEALQQLTEMKDSGKAYVPSFAIALIMLGLGDKKRAIEWLYKAYEERFIWLIYLKVDPLYDPVRGEPEFERLVEMMKFPTVENAVSRPTAA
jgi:serine/threonine-protein kinase